jgi:hypothetical protein
MTISEAKAEGAYEAWNDLLSKFTPEQRMAIAHHMAHSWTVDGIRLNRQGALKVFTPDGVHGKKK